MASILFIQKLFASQDRVVKYNPDAPPGFKARCPVCEFCGFEAFAVEVYQTIGEIRYCSCTHCLTPFRAAGASAAEIKAAKKEAEAAAVEIEKRVVEKKAANKKKKKGGKK